MKAWFVDEKSFELAEYFAQGEDLTEDEVRQLSQEIQDAVESFLQYRRAVVERKAEG